MIGGLHSFTLYYVYIKHKNNTHRSDPMIHTLTMHTIWLDQFFFFFPLPLGDGAAGVSSLFFTGCQGSGFDLYIGHGGRVSWNSKRANIRQSRFRCSACGCFCGCNKLKQPQAPHEHAAMFLTCNIIFMDLVKQIIL